MMRFWSTVFVFSAGACLGVLSCQAPTVSRTHASDVRAENSEAGKLTVELQTIKDRLPDQAHAMQDVANQFTNVWFAGGKRHWELANFYLGETRNHLRWAVRIIPKRKDNAGREVDLPSILKAMENGPLGHLESVIKAKDAEHFEAAYKLTMENCYACHKAADKPYLRPQIPTGPATQIINFDPSAKWPL